MTAKQIKVIQYKNLEFQFIIFGTARHATTVPRIYSIDHYPDLYRVRSTFTNFIIVPTNVQFAITTKHVCTTTRKSNIGTARTTPSRRDRQQQKQKIRPSVSSMSTTVNSIQLLFSNCEFTRAQFHQKRKQLAVGSATIVGQFFNMFILAQILSAGPSFTFNVVIRWSSLRSINACPSISCARNSSAYMPQLGSVRMKL